MEANGLKTRVKNIFEHYEVNANMMQGSTGITANTFRNIIHGKTNQIRLPTLISILQQFPKVDARWLITGEGRMLREKSYTNNNEHLNLAKEPSFCPECYRKLGEIETLQKQVERFESKNSVLLEKTGRLQSELNQCLGNMKKKAV